MTSIRRLETIRVILESELPPKLAEKNLPNFDSYEVNQPYVLQQDSVSITTMGWSKDLDNEVYKVGLTFQLASGDPNIYLYESVIVPAVFELLQPEKIEMVLIASVESMTYPPNDENAVWVKVVIEYITPLDTGNFIET